ncbi:MAG: hypothetical protein WDO56_04410 [Gammaproteobacteria bacterium]
MITTPHAPLRGAHRKAAEANIEDINYKAAHGLDKRQIAIPFVQATPDQRGVLARAMARWYRASWY